MNDALSEPIDLAKLRLRFDDDDELLAEIFRVFIDEAPERRSGMEAALAAGDLPQLTRQAHSLKGVAGTMFAERLRLAAYDLEVAARAGDDGRIESHVSLVLRLLDEAAGFIGGLV